MADSNETILRLLQIMHGSDEGHPLNSTQIIRMMYDHYGQRMGRDTVYHEITTLQYCGYDIVQCEQKRNGWYMRHHEFEDWQLKIMIDSIMHARCITEEEAGDIIKKLLKLTSTEGAKKLSSIYLPKGKQKNGNAFLGRYLDLILNAIHTNRRITFQYTELDENMNRAFRREGRPYELSVYALYWAEDTYYVIGGHEKLKAEKALTNYRLDRMENVAISDKVMIPARNFTGPNPDVFLQEYIDRQVNHYSGSTIRLTLEFEPNPLNMALLAELDGYDLSVKRQRNGMSQVRLVKMDSPTLRGWLVRYASRFQVIEPAGLKKEIIAELEESLKKYKH